MGIKRESIALVQKIKESEAFKMVADTAIQVAAKKWRLFRLLGQVSHKMKANNQQLDKGLLRKVKEKVLVFAALVKASAKGEYTDLPKESLLKIVAGLLYFLLVPDLIPDLLPIFGLADDLSLLLWIGSSLEKDLQAFEQWRLQQTPAPTPDHQPEPETSEKTEQADPTAY